MSTTMPNEDQAPDSLENSSSSSTTADLEVQLQIALAERDACLDRFLRAQAELENYRKRAQRERDDERKYACLPFFRDLLPIIDNLHRAVEAAKKSSNIDELKTGVEMTLKLLDGVLTRYSAQPIAALGEKFDPNLHAALTQIPTNEHPPMTVLQEVERGYTMHDRVIRPTTVIVASPAT